MYIFYFIFWGYFVNFKSILFLGFSILQMTFYFTWPNILNNMGMGKEVETVSGLTLLSHTHARSNMRESFWRTLGEFQTSLWSSGLESSLTCRTMVSSLLYAFICHWVEYITLAPDKSIHVSLSLLHNDTLYIFPAREFLQDNSFNSWTCEQMQRRRRTVGSRQRPCRRRPRKWRSK